MIMVIQQSYPISMQFKNDSTPATNKDHVFEYACEVMSLGLLFLNYRDAIKEGDGQKGYAMLEIFSSCI